MMALRVNNVTKVLKNRNSHSLNFNLVIDELKIQTGEIFALLGPNGSGKTTFIKILLDLIFPETGNIELFGKNNKLKESRKSLGYLPEDFIFPTNYTFKDCLYYFGRMNKFPKEKVISKIVEVSNKLMLNDIMFKKVKNLSKGMLQQLGLTNALINGDKLLILDEPFNGLDPVQKRNSMNILSELNDKHNITILFTSHILSDVEIFCKQIALIKNGRIIDNNSKKEILLKYQTVENYYFKYFKI